MGHMGLARAALGQVLADEDLVLLAHSRPGHGSEVSEKCPVGPSPDPSSTLACFSVVPGVSPFPVPFCIPKEIVLCKSVSSSLF